MRKAKLTSTMIVLALSTGAADGANAALPPTKGPLPGAPAPTKKGAGAPAVPACWSDVAATELDVRTKSAALAAAIGGDAGDRTTKAGALQAHARQTSLAWFSAWGYAYVIVLPWFDLYWAPHYYAEGCDANPSASSCQGLNESLRTKSVIVEAREKRAREESQALQSLASGLVTAGNTPAVRAQAAALVAATESLRTDGASCMASSMRWPTGDPPAKVERENIGGKLDLAGVLTLQAFKNATVAANADVAILDAKAMELAARVGEANELRAKLRDAIVVLRNDSGKFPVPTSRPQPKGVPQDPPKVSAGGSFSVGTISGDFEVKIEGKTFRIDDMIIDAIPGELRVSGAPFGLGECVQNLGAGSKIVDGKLSLSGKLACGPLSGTGKIRIGRGIDGSVKTTLFGHQFDLDLAWSDDQLQGSTTWAAASSGWQAVPGIDLEFRVEGPVIGLAMKGSRVTFSFDANKLELRSKSKKPDGNPWAYAYVDPPSQSFSADGKLSLDPPSLPTPSDAFKAERDACIDVANKASPPGKVRNTAIGVCNADHPAPPSIPAPPVHIEVEVSVVVD